MIDVAIVGGGIAGLSLAKFLAEEGIPFILFEEHKEFFKKVCGEATILKLAGYDFYDFYDGKGIEREIEGAYVHTKYGENFLHIPLLILDKKKVEEEIAKKAEKQGEIRMGEKVRKIENGIIYPQEIKAKIIVGADGALSIVRDYIGIKKPNLGFAVDSYTKEVDLDKDYCHVFISNDIVKYGYAWFFPKKDKWNIGIGTFKKKYFKPAFFKFKKKWKLKWKGAYIPIDKPIKSYGKNAILLGDAACHVIAAVGAGIMPSMIISKIASEFIKDFLNGKAKLKEYEIRWKKEMGRQFNYAYYMSWIYWNLIRSEYIRYKILEKLCKKAKDFYKKLQKK